MKTDNELIAEFMGAQFHKLDTGFGEFTYTYYYAPGNHPNPHCNAATYKKTYEMEYDKRWEWLMPVVEKIVKIDFPEKTHGSTFEFSKDSCTFYKFSFISDKSLIDACWTVCIEFIKWHNKNGN